jgi:hypothetical protein
MCIEYKWDLFPFFDPFFIMIMPIKKQRGYCSIFLKSQRIQGNQPRFFVSLPG